MLDIIICVFASIFFPFAFIASMMTTFNVFRSAPSLALNVGEGSLNVVPFNAQRGVQTRF